MMGLMRVPLLLLAAQTSYIYMAVHNPETTTLSHISELLIPEECQELYVRLAAPQMDAKQSSEKDLFASSQWQGISNMDQCKDSLSHWLATQKGPVDWDRLARALRQIGRPDISRELKKSLNQYRALEPKWNTETNQTAEAPQAAPLVENQTPKALEITWDPEAHQAGEPPKTTLLVDNKDPSQRSHDNLIPKDRIKALMDKSWEMFSLHILRLQQCISQLALMVTLSFLSGMIVWLISVYYIVCWSSRQCLFANGDLYDTKPERRNMNLTVIWNQPASEDSTDDDDDLSSSDDGNDEKPTAINQLL